MVARRIVQNQRRELQHEPVGSRKTKRTLTSRRRNLSLTETCRCHAVLVDFVAEVLWPKFVANEQGGRVQPSRWRLLVCDNFGRCESRPERG
jgi:hypothetical protein